MITRLVSWSFIGLGVLALTGPACSNDPSGDDEADSSSDTTGDGSTEGETGTDAGTDTGTSEGTACDQEAFDACLESATETPCSIQCPDPVLSCTDAGCVGTCEVAVAEAVAACRDMHCPEADNEVELCEQACWQEFSTCATTSECDLRQCQWDAGFCLPDCIGCTADVKMDFVYEGSCEIPMPELVHPVLFTYFAIEAGGQTFDDVLDEGMPCDPADLAGTIEHPLEGDVLVLCPAACDAFTDAGSMHLSIHGACG